MPSALCLLLLQCILGGLIPRGNLDPFSRLFTYGIVMGQDCACDPNISGGASHQEAKRIGKRLMNRMGRWGEKRSPKPFFPGPGLRDGQTEDWLGNLSFIGSQPSPGETACRKDEAIAGIEI
jgi:hypothetical protein